MQRYQGHGSILNDVGESSGNPAFFRENKGTKGALHRLIRVGASYKLVLHLPRGQLGSRGLESGSLRSAGEESAECDRQVGKGVWT